MAKVLIVGNPENRRNSYFISALEKNKINSYKIISYTDLIRGIEKIEDYLEDGSILRIESPGENFEVEKLLIAFGDRSKSDILNEKEQVGKIFFPTLWYKGYFKFLTNLKYRVSTSDKRVVYMNEPEEILEMFNKNLCQKKLKNGNINIPDYYENVNSYEELIESMYNKKLRGIFIKLSYSSSASGIGAFRINYKTGEQVFYSTIVPVDKSGKKEYFNSLKVIRYCNKEQIKEIIEMLMKEDIHIEEWIPKACCEGEQFDVRVVVIDNKPMQSVVRLSKSPMTNLHLGNKRITLEESGLKKELIKKILDSAVKAKAQFPNSLYAGIDVMVSKQYNRTYVADVNAFGDLLMNIYIDGKNSYESEIDAIKCLI